MGLWCLPLRHRHGVTGYECLLQVVGAQPTEPVLPQPRADHLLLLPPGDATWGPLPASVKPIVPGGRGGGGQGGHRQPRPSDQTQGLAPAGGEGLQEAPGLPGWPPSSSGPPCWL